MSFILSGLTPLRTLQRRALVWRIRKDALLRVWISFSSIVRSNLGSGWYTQIAAGEIINSTYSSLDWSYVPCVRPHDNFGELNTDGSSANDSLIKSCPTNKFQTIPDLSEDIRLENREGMIVDHFRRPVSSWLAGHGTTARYIYTKNRLNRDVASF